MSEPDSSDARSTEEIARAAAAIHMLSTGSYLRPTGVICVCGERSYNPTERSNHKADAVVLSLRMAGRLMEE